MGETFKVFLLIVLIEVSLFFVPVMVGYVGARIDKFKSPIKSQGIKKLWKQGALNMLVTFTLVAIPLSLLTINWSIADGIATYDDRKIAKQKKLQAEEEQEANEIRLLIAAGYTTINQE